MMRFRRDKRPPTSVVPRRAQRMLFVHIPKTAGTSLRKSLQRQCMTEELLCDYGPDSEVTSGAMKRTPLDSDARLRRAMAYPVICGHFPLDRYAVLFDPREVLCFTRAPLQQLQSHYAHFQRLHGYQEDLETFALSSHGLGVQSRLLKNCPPQLLGYVGTTEQYAKDLQAISGLWGVDLALESVNRNPDNSQVSSRYNYPGDDFARPSKPALIADRLLHARAQRGSKHRRAAIANQQPWVHGAIVQLTATHIEIAAYHACNSPRSGAVVVRVMVNGNQHAIVQCNSALATPLPIRVPCSGRVAGTVSFAEELQAGTVIEVYEADTGQWLDALQLYRDSVLAQLRPGPLIE